MMSDEKRSSEQTRFGILLVVLPVSSLIMLSSNIAAVVACLLAFV
jgi:hypothetical protein